MNDPENLELAITLVLSVIHLGGSGSSDKDKMRTSLRTLMEAFLGYGTDKFSKFKRNAALIGNEAMEEH